MRAAIIMGLSALVLFSGLAFASHSAPQCEAIVMTIGTGDATIYYVDGQDESAYGGDFDWLYAESNGHSGLQRGGNAWWSIGTGDGGVDWCWDVAIATGWEIENPDSILF